MIKLKADFWADWVAALRDRMVRLQGLDAAEVHGLDERAVPVHYFESSRRRLVLRPRMLEIADDFRCPLDMSEGWSYFREKVIKGADLNPHLSLRHASIRNQDGLLAEWSVQHFHLGTAPHSERANFIARTTPLLYAFVDDDAFYAINIYADGHRKFEETEIVESIHRNWPHRIAKYRINGVTGVTLNKSQRRSVRKKNCNISTTLSDGTAYMPLSGGITLSGVSMEAVINADKWWFLIDDFQRRFEKELKKVLPILIQEGYAGEDEVEAELRVADQGYQVYFSKYGVLANVVSDLPLPDGRDDSR
jgi:hypothetical protein